MEIPAMDGSSDGGFEGRSGVGGHEPYRLTNALNGAAIRDERTLMPAHRHRRIKHLQRLAGGQRAGTLDVLLAVASAGHRQALALGRRDVAAGVADAVARIQRRHGALLLRLRGRLRRGGGGLAVRGLLRERGRRDRACAEDGCQCDDENSLVHGFASKLGRTIVHPGTGTRSIRHPGEQVSFILWTLPGRR